MDDVAKQMLDELAKTPNVSPALRRVMEHLYRVGRVVMKSPAGDTSSAAAADSSLGPTRSVDDFAAPYNAHLAQRHVGEEIEALPLQPNLNELVYAPPPPTPVN